MKIFKDGITKQASLGIIYRGFTLLLGYLSVRVQIDYLGSAQYGLWATISSIFGFLVIFDIGLGTGLQNQLIESYSGNDDSLARRLISTTYSIMAFITAAVFLTGLLLIKLVPAGFIIDTLDLSSKETQGIMLIMLASSSVILFLKIYAKIYNSLKRTSTVLLTGLIAQAAIFTGFLIMDRLSCPNRLAVVASIKTGMSIIVLLAASILLFAKRPHLKPSIRLFDKTLMGRVAGIGAQFFIIHICWAVINSTDNIIISSQLGSAEVTAFSLVYKLSTLGKVVFFLLLTPFWPQFSEYFYRKDLSAMKNILKKYIRLMIIIDLLLCLGAFFVPAVIRLWTDIEIEIPAVLIIFTTAFVLIDNAVGLFSYCLNAVSRVKLQMYLFIFGAILNIPLSLFLVNLSSESSGAVLASCICYMPLLILLPLQVRKLFKGMSQNAA